MVRFTKSPFYRKNVHTFIKYAIFVAKSMRYLHRNTIYTYYFVEFIDNLSHMHYFHTLIRINCLHGLISKTKINFTIRGHYALNIWHLYTCNFIHKDFWPMYCDADFQLICIWESSLKSASLMRKNYIFLVKDVAFWI